MGREAPLPGRNAGEGAFDGGPWEGLQGRWGQLLGGQPWQVNVSIWNGQNFMWTTGEFASGVVPKPMCGRDGWCGMSATGWRLSGGGGGVEAMMRRVVWKSSLLWSLAPPPGLHLARKRE